MDIVKDLIKLYSGKYFSEGEKLLRTGGGSYIVQSSYGLIEREDFRIQIHNHDNKGIRAPGAYDGSPFKFVLEMDAPLKKDFSMFPKAFFSRLLSPSKGSSAEAKSLSKRFSIKGDKTLVSLLLDDAEFCRLLLSRNIYISSKLTKQNSFIVIRLNESATTLEALGHYVKILDRLGEIIIKNKSSLMIWSVFGA